MDTKDKNGRAEYRVHGVMNVALACHAGMLKGRHSIGADPILAPSVLIIYDRYEPSIQESR
jgi:hypothetical protein